MTTLPYGYPVKFKLGLSEGKFLEGQGIIVGLSHTPLPILGQGYIVFVPDADIKELGYTTFCIDEIHLTWAGKE